MKAIILAAGQGTRLRPHTDYKPKCMVDLAGKPLLHRQLEVLRGVGISKIILIGGYRADQLYAPDTVRLFNPRFDETNMVGTLFCAEDWMNPGEDFLIAYGDIVYDQKVLRSLLETDAPVAISVDRQWQILWEIRMEDPLSDAETLKMTDHNRVIEVGKKPNSLDEIQGQYMGLIKVRGDFVQAFRDYWHGLDRNAIYDGSDFDNMYMTSFLQLLINRGVEVRAAFTEKGWIELDTVKDLERYESMNKDGSLYDLICLDLS